MKKPPSDRKCPDCRKTLEVVFSSGGMMKLPGSDFPGGIGGTPMGNYIIEHLKCLNLDCSNETVYISGEGIG